MSRGKSGLVLSCESQSAAVSAPCCGLSAGSRPGKPFILLDPAQCAEDVFHIHSQCSFRFVKHLSFVVVIVSEPYPSPAEDLAPSKVKLSEPACAPALGRVIGLGEWVVAQPMCEHLQ